MDISSRDHAPHIGSALDGVTPVAIDLEQVIAHSFRDFHVKGFDYLCLKRSPEHTIKAYFFDGDVAGAPEVVMPHDHRYGFDTHVVAGSSANRWYREGVEGYRDSRPFEEFAYRTPLNGGDGFTWKRTAWLRLMIGAQFDAGQRYSMVPDEIHTIQVLEPGTILCLHQFADELPVGVATKAFRSASGRQPPDLGGLYRPMDADHALIRLHQFFCAIGRDWKLADASPSSAEPMPVKALG